MVQRLYICKTYTLTIYNMKNLIVLIVLFSLLSLSCNRQMKSTDNGFIAADTLVKASSFQREIDGKKVDLFTLKNDSGLVVKITNYGATIISVLLPDKHGNYDDICLGYPNLDGYFTDKFYLGHTIGRYANRIAKGKFKLDGNEYQLALNDGVNTLHGGLKGFDKVVWDAVQHGDTLSLSYVSADMEEGYPGKVTVHLTYILTNANELKMEYEATTDKKTIINLTNHAYYNLHGEDKGDILDHQLEILASNTTPVDTTLIPTGEIASVKGTPFDFTIPEFIGKRINDNNQQIKNGKGYDHNWVLDKKMGELTLAVVLTDTCSVRVLELSTTEPGIQFYSGNFLTGLVNGKAGKPHNYRSGLAFEPQHYPDSPNKLNFPSVVLKPGETYKQLSVIRYYVKK